MNKVNNKSFEDIKHIDENEIEKLAQILKNDGVICVPTDTVYGLCASVNSKIAYEKLINVKNRPLNKAFPIMCADEEQIKNIAIVDENSEKLIKNFMPGPITLILHIKNNFPYCINNGKETIAVRMATSKSLEELIKKTGSPIYMTSANKSGEPTCTTIEEIEKKCPQIDGIMEGKVTFGQGSTIVDCTSKKLKILRNGPITSEQINQIGLEIL